MFNWLKGAMKGAEVSMQDISTQTHEVTQIVRPARQQQVKTIVWPTRPLTALELQLMRDIEYVEYTEEQYFKIQKELEIDNIRATLEWLDSPAIAEFIRRETEPDEILRLINERTQHRAELLVLLEELETDPDALKDLLEKRKEAEEKFRAQFNSPPDGPVNLKDMT